MEQRHSSGDFLEAAKAMREMQQVTGALCMVRENVWDNENHEVLYALFILEANRAINVINRPSYWSEEQAVHVAMFNYMLQWSDRAVCEEEFEGWVSKTTRELANTPKHHPFRAGQLHFAWTINQTEKIKFRFVENESE